MPVNRFSKKRQAILDCLRSVKSHPDAEWIHARLLPRFPGLSLGTVYRNLAQMKEQGLVRSVGVVDGKERFDGNVLPHSHVVCRLCGRVADVSFLPDVDSFRNEIGKETGFSVEDCALQLVGLCPDCRKKIPKGE